MTLVRRMSDVIAAECASCNCPRPMLGFLTGLLLVCFCQAGQPQEPKPPQFNKTAAELAAEFSANPEAARKNYFPEAEAGVPRGATVRVTGPLRRLFVVTEALGRDGALTLEYHCVCETPGQARVVVVADRLDGDWAGKGPHAIEAVGRFGHWDGQTLTIRAEKVKFVPVKK
jgi:hypothetical protein